MKLELMNQESEVVVSQEASASDKTRFCWSCGKPLLRYRIIKKEKSCIFLKIKLCCSHDHQFDSFELMIPIS